MKYTYLILISLLLFITGCNQSESNKQNDSNKIIIGISMLSMQNEFIVNISDEMQKKAKELGAELIIVDAERSPLKQIEQVESFIAQKVDVIILNPCEYEASSPAVKKALAAGIPIVNVNSATKVQPTAFVGSNDVESGRIAMKFIVEKLGGKGNIVMIQGLNGQAAQIQREQGAKEIMEQFPGLNMIAQQTAEWDRSKSMDLMQNWIQSYGSKINAVFAHNDEMGLGAVKALQDAGMKDKVIVVSIDAIADALQAVKKGDLDATVFQDARKQGAGAIETAVKIARGKQFDKEVLIPFKLLTKGDVDPYLK
ncbi:sugar ABC transporter substrate-binding protein [Daejeonella sp.]|uniref:sugar ABC transporter substrate-binding protein n=1 Tax=Daejeonella sp. TaxID=2805397 RepID=UPI00271FD92A|nr:sugar ABC transporter substrate-binding protein [Daejeonella sp.]MDO8992889.1 sugar ABC transporter substrate-binding protein [Daejeonella sp.]MDP2414644.1 sugar ABC transporter substrate-binding protein [Daejeonella sp.]